VRVSDVSVLALLRPAGEQNHDGAAILADIDPISGPKIGSVLEDASADTLNVREISKPQPTKCCRNFGGGGSVETPKLGRKRARTCAIEVFEDRQLRQCRRLTQALPLSDAAHAAPPPRAVISFKDSSANRRGGEADGRYAGQVCHGARK
jgi:hypothetical protein